MELAVFIGEIRHAKAMHEKYAENLEKVNSFESDRAAIEFYRKEAATYQIERNKSETAIRRALFKANGDAIIGLEKFISDYIRGRA